MAVRDTVKRAQAMKIDTNRKTYISLVGLRGRGSGVFVALLRFWWLVFFVSVVAVVLMLLRSFFGPPQKENAVSCSQYSR